MITVTTDQGRVVFAAGARFSTEDMFNNLCIHDRGGQLLAVFEQDKWVSAEVGDGGQEQEPE